MSHLGLANEQRTSKEEPRERFTSGKENAHDLLDSKDNRTLANVLNHAETEEGREKEREKEREESEVVQDPTAAARRHGNEPSRGAEIDKEIKEEEEEHLRRKGKI